MHVKTFKISSFMGFRETERISLSRGFNVVVGPNNAGKSALIKALSPELRNLPHRHANARRSQPLQQSKIELVISLSGDELLTEVLPEITDRVVLPAIERRFLDIPDEMIGEIRRRDEINCEVIAILYVAVSLTPRRAG